MTIQSQFSAWRTIAWLLLVVSFAAFSQTGPAAPAASPKMSIVPESTGPLDSIRSWLGGASKPAALVPPDQAFGLEVQAKDANTLVATLTPAADYYMYRDKVSFTVVPPSIISIVDVSLPKGEPKADPTFGTVQVYRQAFKAIISLRHAQAGAESVTLQATYQGCNEPLGVCYPPIDKTVTVALSGPALVAEVRPLVAAESRAPSASPSFVSPVAEPSELDVIGQLFAQDRRWAVIASFFGFGILLAFTPCMLPMIPILSGIIAGHGSQITRRHALGLSAVFVLSMAVTYALVGVAAGLAGTLLSAYLQNPWVLGSFAAIFVLLALSMFGLYELQLPTALQTRLAAVSGRVRGGKVIGASLMGVLSAVIVGPCVAAPLAGALLYISQTHDVVLGGSALFALAIGMGVPLLVVGATTGSVLPKAGAWTEAVKRVFGVIMLAVAVYMLTPVIPVVAQQLLWAALLIVPAIYLHALDPLPADVPGHRRLFKGIGVLSLLVGAAMLLGALSGHREILQPLAGLRGAGAERIEKRELAFQRVRTLNELDARVQAARGRPVMLDFWAEWCVSCKEMDQFTFSDSRVQARLHDVLVLRADVTANNADDQALLRRFSLFGPPGIIFFDPQGQELKFRVIGFESADKFLRSLDRALVPARQAQTGKS